MYLIVYSCKMSLTTLIFVLFSFFEISSSVRILGVVPTPSYSHQIVFRPIWNELSRRGHEVVVITTDPQNDPDLNITEIDISFAYDLWTRKYSVIKIINDYKYNIIKMYEMMTEIINDICKEELLHPGVQNLLRNESEHFDLVIVEYLFPHMFGFSARFKCPYIGVVSLDMPNPFHALLGNPNHPVLYPDFIQLGFAGKLDFWQRLTSVAFTALGKVLEIFFGGFETQPAVNELVKEQFGKDTPPLLDIVKNVSMVFINDNPAFALRPLGPAFVLIGGGTHLTPVKPLPQDIKEYLDGATNGFIYFSLGTNVKSDVFLPEMRKIVLDAFRDLPYKVLWKFDITDIPDVPENVKIMKWVPQQDILRHPNIKVFITQGGLQSTEEAIFSHVPIVGIPFVADQAGNVKKLVARGGGIFLDKDALTTESVEEALLEVINNPKYKESVIEIAELSKDQPMTGIEKAIWWTEYVIRHKGARHLRNPAIDLPLYQYYLLDVIGFVLAVISVVLFISYKLIVFIKRIFLSYFSKKNKMKTN